MGNNITQRLQELLLYVLKKTQHANAVAPTPHPTLSAKEKRVKEFVEAYRSENGRSTSYLKVWAAFAKMIDPEIDIKKMINQIDQHEEEVRKRASFRDHVMYVPVNDGTGFKKDIPVLHSGNYKFMRHTGNVNGLQCARANEWRIATEEEIKKFFFVLEQQLDMGIEIPSTVFPREIK